VSKLLKLKAWLTLDDAAGHLSLMFGEAVSKADVLRLALDGRLTLSVNFINGAKARCGPMIESDQVQWTELPGPKGGTVRIPDGVMLKDGSAIRLENEVVSLRGIYDLPMLGNERLDVEHLYQQLTDGPEVTLQGLDGPFVVAGDGLYCQVLESLDDNEFQAGSAARGRELEARIEREELSKEEAAVLRREHKAEREQFKKRRAERPASEGYYPAGGLPQDAVFVVRTDALAELLAAASEPEHAKKDIGTRERDTLLKLLIGMAVAGYKYSPNESRSHTPVEIASDLQGLGISMTDDTVRKWLKEARAMLPGKTPRA
jgi:hypothetical protein